MLSDCANPECSEQFRYLHQGKMFCLIPTPKAAATSYGSLESLYERFWLCDRCSKELKVTWDGPLRLPRAENKDSPWLLPFDEAHRAFGIDSRRFDSFRR